MPLSSLPNVEQTSLYIGGKYVSASSGEFFETVNPATADTLAKLQSASKADVDKAVQSAKEGQKIWASMTAVERSRILLKAVAILREENDKLARLETADTGKAISETAYVDIVTGADVLEYYAGLATAVEGVQVPLRTGKEGSFFYTQREPLGVVAGIGAWNYPIQIALWKSAPALASGNAMIFKPSEVTPLTALKLAEIYTQAGVPDGVFNVVQGGGDVGAYLTEHPDIAKISFTGSVATGKKVMSLAGASSLKDVTMELGGKSPLIVCDDADIELAADVAMMANFYSTGQVCTNGTRVFVPSAKKHAFEQAILARLPKVRLGDPTDETTNMGPLVSFAHMERVLDYMEQGKKAGATVLFGGRRAVADDFAERGESLSKGAFVLPTVFTDCTDEMSIVTDEIFGPVMSILTYDDEDEAIERANDTIFGLAGGVVTSDLNKAHRITHALQAGICWVNTWGESDAKMPVGGYKQSGVGRENGIMTLEHYTQVKSIQIEMGKFESIFK
mgnify:CR=1 FL=1